MPRRAEKRKSGKNIDNRTAQRRRAIKTMMTAIKQEAKSRKVKPQENQKIVKNFSVLRLDESGKQCERISNSIIMKRRDYVRTKTKREIP